MRADRETFEFVIKASTLSAAPGLLTSAKKADILYTIIRESTQHGKLAEDHCNGTCEICKGSDTCERQVNMEAFLETEAAKIGYTVDFENDPRGYTVTLVSVEGTRLDVPQ